MSVKENDVIYVIKSSDVMYLMSQVFMPQTNKAGIY